jgi:hypothetical protein
LDDKKVLVVGVMVGFNKGLAIEELDKEVLNWTKRS